MLGRDLDTDDALRTITDMAKTTARRRDPRIDALISNAPPFSRPILKRVRTWIHRHGPAVEESVKWGHAAFLYRGKILCGVGSFKNHCTFGFWHPLMRNKLNGPGMGQFGKMTSTADLPSEAVFAEMMATAMRLEDEGIKPSPTRKPPKPTAVVPDDLAAAFRRHAAARKHFDALSNSCRREYIEWITEAKRPETREKRLATTLDQLVDGKKLHWKYDC